MTFSKLRVAFKNVYRTVLGLPKWSSVTEMYATHNIENFEDFCERLYMYLYSGLKTAVM